MNTAFSESSAIDDLLIELAEISGRSLDTTASKPALPSDHSDARLVVIDDAAVNLKVLERHLTGEGYTKTRAFTSPREALVSVSNDPPDVILLDIMMPEMSGLDFLRVIRSQEQTRHVPVIILSASKDRDTRIEALDLGAMDFLAKPVDRLELATRLRNVLMIKAHRDQLEQYSVELEEAVRTRTAELAASRLEVVHCLARASEFRDDITGRHVFRVGRYAGIISRAIGMNPAQSHLLELAAQLHDVGKIAIPDSILLKEGKLDPEEYATMQRHCGLGKRVFDKMENEQVENLREHASLGGEILGTARSPLVRLASRIALTHHEWWDGTGYPLGLEGEDIPLEGRITAVADVFDALSCRRPYKNAFPLSRCFKILNEQSGTQFEPRLIEAFMDSREQVIAVQLEHADVG